MNRFLKVTTWIVFAFGAVVAFKLAGQLGQEVASAKQQVQTQQIALDAAEKATAEARAEAKLAGEHAAELKGQLAALREQQK